MNGIAPLAALLLASIAATAPIAAPAQTPKSAPVAAPVPHDVPDAQDVPYPGTITLDIDASDVARGVYRVVETIPVPQGATGLILQLPAWLPGNHSPRGPINQLSDLRFEAGGQPIGWTRDPVEVHAFHLALPPGTREVTARFVHTSPTQTSEGRITMTPAMLNLQWERMSLYPAGHYVRQITIRPRVTFPAGWTAYAALDGERRTGDTVAWAPVDYETLVDSPVFAGENAQSWDLGHAVRLNVVADEGGQLALAPENLATFERLVDESLALFSTRQFDRYEFLLAMSDKLGGIGLEHHRSSENSYEPNSFTDWDTMAHDRNVIAHEFVHSWNGKFRRPEGLWTPDYREPMRDNLLWMYEGQTQFWGWVLAARSGLQPKETVLGAIANNVGYYSVQPGRAWRSVEDTTLDPIINSRRPLPYASLMRSEDYYNEGMMVWLEADQIIRAGTGGQKGLDDFARAFFGLREGDWGQVTYDFDDIVAALNAVHPYDWADFLTTRIRMPGQPAPIRGVEMGGYRLVWKEEPNPYEAGRMRTAKNLTLQYSLGLTLSAAGEVSATMWGGPAFDAGIVNGATILAVNGTAWSEAAIKRAITAARDGAPLELTVKRGEQIRTVAVNYDGGLRYPWIEPAGEGEQPLDRLLAPRAQ